MKQREEQKWKAFSSVWNPASKAARQGIRILTDTCELKQ